MAYSKRKAFYVGIFVLIGSAIAIAALIWLGIADWFAGKSTYVTYFDASVQGLNVDSEVKFRGVNIGKVSGVKVAPDGNLIEVIIRLDPEFSVKDSLRARLGFTGITGMKYVALDYVSEEKLGFYPKLDFKPPHKVIPSQPGGFEEIEQSLRAIYEKLMVIDTEGISIRANKFLDAGTNMMTSADSVIRAVDSLVHYPGITAWVDNLERTVDRLDGMVAKFDERGYDKDIDSILTELHNGSRRFGSLMAKLDTNVQELRVNQHIDSLFGEVRRFVITSQEMVSRTEYTTMQALNAMNTTMQEMDNAIDQLNALMMSMESYPSSFLFSAPPQSER